MSHSSTISLVRKKSLLKIGAIALALMPTISMAGNFLRDSYEPKQFLSEYEDVQARYLDKEKPARESNSKLTDYAQAGISLSDVSCDNWLHTLAYSDRNTSFFKDILNIVGNLFIGIAGINGANPSSLAKGSIGLSAGNASIESFKNEIILGTISDIAEKLKEGRRVSATYFLEHIPNNYDETRRRLSEYHDSCSPGAVKNLLKTSMASVKYVAPDTSLASAADQAKSDVLANLLFIKVYTATTPGNFSNDTLYKLYIRTIAVAPGAASALFNASNDDAYLKGLIASFTAGDAASAERIAILGNISELRGYPARLQADLQKENQAKLASAEQAAQTQAEQKAQQAVTDAKQGVAAAMTPIKEEIKNKTPGTEEKRSDVAFVDGIDTIAKSNQALSEKDLSMISDQIKKLNVLPQLKANLDIALSNLQTAVKTNQAPPPQPIKSTPTVSAGAVPSISAKLVPINQ